MSYLAPSIEKLIDENFSKVKQAITALSENDNKLNQTVFQLQQKLLEMELRLVRVEQKMVLLPSPTQTLESVLDPR